MRRAADGPTVRKGSILRSTNAHAEATMARNYLDCREFPSDVGCTLAMSADSEEELLEAAVAHAVASHGHNDSPQFRDMLRKLFRQGEVKP
jgi:predicted small metal-binding protein